MSTPEINYINSDCMKHMKYFPDNYFDLAIVDPPYGSGDPGQVANRFGKHFDRYLQVNHTGANWQKKHEVAIAPWDITPDKEYFDELFRISQNQIIWGGNYFDLPPSRNFIIWHKTSIPEGFNMASVEFAWVSKSGNAKIWHGVTHGSPSNPRIHPTQKPVALYEWILKNYAQKGNKILDTHVGSGSIMLACWHLGFDFVGFEINVDYYEGSLERFERCKRQPSLLEMLDEEKGRSIVLDQLSLEDLAKERSC